MNISEINQWLALVLTVGGLAVTAIGYTWTVKSQIGNALNRLKDLSIRIDKVETENSQTLGVLTEIKVQLSAIETTLKLFLKDK